MGGLTSPAAVGILAAGTGLLALAVIAARQSSTHLPRAAAGDATRGRCQPQQGRDINWQRTVVTAGELRRRGLARWPAAVGVWWPKPGGAGVLVCQDCVNVRPASAVGLRADHELAVVLLGLGARQRVERRCAVHTARFPGPPRPPT